MDTNLTFFNILMLIGAIQGLVLGSLLLFNKKGRRASSLFLAAILFIIAFDNLETFFGDSLLDQQFPLLYLLSFSLYMAFGPAIYFYTLSVVDPFFKLKKVHLLHFLPILIDLINYQSYFLVDFKLSILNLNTSLQGLSAMVGDFGALILGSFYLSFSLGLINKRYACNELNRQSYIWLSKLIYAAFIQFALWFAYFTYLLVFDVYNHSEIRPYFLYAYLSILIYWLSIEGFLFSIKETSETKRKKISVVDSNLLKLVLELNQTMESEKLYLDQDLTLHQLASRLNINSKMMSQVLNTGLHKSFNEYINEFRVKEATERLINPAYSHLSILGIAFESGFKSKATFNRIFKENMGMSPKEFQTISEEKCLNEEKSSLKR